MARQVETPKPPGNAMTLGRVVRLNGNETGGSGFPIILCHDPVLQPHLTKPWVKAWIGRELGLSPPRRKRQSETAAVQETDLARNCLAVGTIGCGKSRLYELMFGQLLQRGHSLIALEPKIVTIRQMVAQAQAAGLAPEQVTILSPHVLGGIPGWNPFLTGLPATESASDFFALIAGNAISWGIRLGDVLANIAVVVAHHRLSVYELMQALRNPDYLQVLLDRPPPDQPSAAYLEAVDALKHEFLAGSKSERIESARAVANKIRETLRNDFLKDLITARANTMDLPQLWKRQGVILVHVDRASLGEEGAKLLAGMIASSLFRTSLRVTGPVPVTLALDEISTTARFVGEILEQIAVFSRSANLRLLAAMQNLSQTEGPLREAMLSANVQVSFRLSPSDARLVAASLAAGTEPSIARVHAEAHAPRRQGGPVPRSVWRHRLYNAAGRPLRLDSAEWQRLQGGEMFRLPGPRAPSEGPLGALCQLAAQHGIARLYVRDAYSGEPVEVRHYIAGLNPAAYWVDGPQPLALVVSFPTPRLTGAERRGETDATRAWTRVLQSLPVQHAVLRIGGAGPVVMRVTDVPETAQTHIGPYQAAALRANGQSAEEIAACANERRETVLRLARGEEDTAAGTGTPKVSAPRPTFRTRPPQQERPSTTNTKTDNTKTNANTGGPDGTPFSGKQSNRHRSDEYRSHGETPGGPSPFSFDDAGFAEDGSLG